MSDQPPRPFPNTSHVDAYRRKRTWAMTAEQRSEAGVELIRTAFEQLRANPVAYQAFLKREHHKRRDQSEQNS